MLKETKLVKYVTLSVFARKYDFVLQVILAMALRLKLFVLSSFLQCRLEPDFTELTLQPNPTCQSMGVRDILEGICLGESDCEIPVQGNSFHNFYCLLKHEEY